MLVLSQSLLSNKNGRCSTSFKMNSWAADLSSLRFQPLTVVKDLTVFVPLKSHDAQVKKQPIVFANVAYKFVAMRNLGTMRFGVKVGD